MVPTTQEASCGPTGSNGKLPSLQPFRAPNIRIYSKLEPYTILEYVFFFFPETYMAVGDAFRGPKMWFVTIYITRPMKALSAWGNAKRRLKPVVWMVKSRKVWFQTSNHPRGSRLPALKGLMGSILTSNFRFHNWFLQREFVHFVVMSIWHLMLHPSRTVWNYTTTLLFLSHEATLMI